MIQKNEVFNIVDKDIFISNLISKKIKKDFNKIETLIKSTISKKIKFQELLTTPINGKNQSLIYIKSKLLNEKNISEITKLIFTSFSSNPFIFELEKADYSYFLLNSSYLENEKLNFLINKSTGKKSFLLVKVSKKNFSDYLKYENLLNDNVLNMFNDIIYKFIYIYVLKIDKEFKRYIDYSTLLQYSEIPIIERKIISLKRKSKKTFNLKDKSEINLEIFNYQKKYEKYKHDFEVEYMNLEL